MLYKIKILTAITKGYVSPPKHTVMKEDVNVIPISSVYFANLNNHAM